MPTAPTRVIPAGYTTVTPWIIGHDTAGLIDWLGAAFGAEELNRLTDEHGVIGHAEVRIGDAVVMMFDSPPGWAPTPAFLRLYLPDSDATFARAVAAGGTPVTEVTELFFGDRVGRVRDPFGNLYWLQTRVVELTEAETMARMADPAFQQAMAYVSNSIHAPAFDQVTGPTSPAKPSEPA